MLILTSYPHGRPLIGPPPALERLFIAFGQGEIKHRGGVAATPALQFGLWRDATANDYGSKLDRI